MHVVRRYFESFLDVLFPRLCAGCERELLPVSIEKAICTDCLFRIEQTNFHLSPQENASYFKFAGKIPLQGACSCFYFDKAGRMQRIVHALKYHSRALLGNEVGFFYGEMLKQTSWIQSIDVIVPVPLHARRLQERGYNQAERFAAGLSKALHLPVRPDLFYRKTYTRSQTGKQKQARWNNVKTIFTASKKNSQLPKSVLLVDDVITTGSTLEAAARCLLEMGVEKIWIASLAVARSGE